MVSPFFNCYLHAPARRTFPTNLIRPYLTSDGLVMCLSPFPGPSPPIQCWSRNLDFLILFSGSGAALTQPLSLSLAVALAPAFPLSLFYLKKVVKIRVRCLRNKVPFQSKSIWDFPPPPNFNVDVPGFRSDRVYAKSL